MSYIKFLNTLDEYLKECFESQKEHICCQAGCSSCCETGDYPISRLELEYLMQGYISLSNETKSIVQKQIQTMERGKACPFLIQKKCSVYSFRPIVCRVHGLAYFSDNKKVKVPYCANEGKNYSSVYKDGIIEASPINENLDTQNLINEKDFGEIRYLYDWLK